MKAERTVNHAVRRALILGLSFLPTLFERAVAQCDPSKFVGHEVEGNVRFGCSLAADARRVLVGSFRGGSSHAGAAYLFTFNGLRWTQEQRLVADDFDFGDDFGFSVALDGPVAVVGSPNNDEPADREGAAYVFRHDGSTWNFEQKLISVSPDPVDLFGYSVGVSGNHVVVGARGDDTNGEAAGAAYVFRYDGSAWVFEQELFGTEEGQPLPSAFGFSADIHDNLIIVGAPWDDRLEGDGGAAYVYRFDQTEWELESALLPPRFSIHAGFSVRIGGSTALVGASDTGSEGTVFAYEFNGSQWRLDQSITPPQRIGRANFGYAMDFEGDRLVIGAYGAFDHLGVAYLFERQGGGDWSPLIRFDPFDVHDTLGAPPFFGDACALSGDLILIGAPYEDTDHGGDSGIVYAFRHECGADCTGTERIKKAVCISGDLTVKLLGGIPGDAFEALLATGETAEGSLNRRGKATVRFSGLPNGTGRVDVSWGCGADADAAFFCP